MASPDLLPANLVARIDFPTDLSGCWLWHGQLTEHGYGRFKKAAAHRLVYAVLREPVAPSLTLHHLCSTRNCVNPEHLEPLSRIDHAERHHAPVRAARYCPNGHEYTEANTYWFQSARWQPRPGRRCRRCGANRVREYARRQREALRHGK